jgi:hypothetical protein
VAETAKPHKKGAILVRIFNLNRRSFLASVAVIAIAPALSAAEMHMLEIDVAATENNWATNFSGTWTNTNTTPVIIKTIKGYFVGAASLVGEEGAWLIIPGRTTGDIGVFTPANGPQVSGELIFAFGSEAYVPPSQPIEGTLALNDDEITLQPGEQLMLLVNTGPINLPTGGTSAPFTFTGAIRAWYHF